MKDHLNSDQGHGYSDPETVRLAAMRIIRKYKNDKEERHRRLDELLLQVMGRLGYSETCDLFRAVRKWYA